MIWVNVTMLMSDLVDDDDEFAYQCQCRSVLLSHEYKFSYVCQWYLLQCFNPRLLIYYYMKILVHFSDVGLEAPGGQLTKSMAMDLKNLTLAFNLDMIYIVNQSRKHC